MAFIESRVHTIDNAFDCVPFYEQFLEYEYVKKMQSIDNAPWEKQTWGKPLFYPDENIDVREGWKPIWDIISPQIEEKIGEIELSLRPCGNMKAYPEIAYINLFDHGDNSFIHTDREGYTAICYMNPNWNYNWGGETFFYKDDEVIHCQLPKGGSLVFFRGQIPHRAGLVSSNAPFPRMGLTYMFNKV